MGIDTIANVTITKATTYPSSKGFGTVLFAVYHTAWDALARSFSGATILDELVDLGVPTYHPMYLGVQAMLSQQPRGKSIVIGRRKTAYTQTVTLTPKSAVEGTKYSFSLVSPAGVVTAINYTVPAAATLTSVGTAIAALIDPISDLTAVSVTGVITCTTAVGKFVVYKDLPGISLLELDDTTADPGIASDLSAIADAAKLGGLSWYGLTLDQGGKATITAAAAWAEARTCLFVARSSDAGCAGSLVTTDVFSALKTSGYARTAGIFAASSTGDFRDLAWLSQGLTYTPGTATFAFKRLAGVPVDKLLSGEESAIQAKNGTTYTEIAGVSVTFEGHTADGDYLDNTAAIDWAYQEIQLGIFGEKIASPKTPFTRPGIAAQKAVVAEVFERGITLGSFDSYTVEVPDLDDTLAADRADRRLVGVTFTARLSGAIHKVQINGTIGV